MSRNSARSLHGKSLISLVIIVQHRMEYVFMIILYRMIISSASPRNRIVDRLYHTAWRSEGLYSISTVLPFKAANLVYLVPETVSSSLVILNFESVPFLAGTIPCIYYVLSLGFVNRNFCISLSPSCLFLFYAC